MKNEIKNTDQKLAEQTVEALDASIEQLSPDISTRLKAARRTALAVQEKPEINQNWHQFQFFSPKTLSAGLALSVCLLVFWNLLPLNSQQQTPTFASSQNLSAFILLSTLDETELDIIEDIEFAYWLAQELETQGSSDTSSLGTHNNG